MENYSKGKTSSSRNLPMVKLNSKAVLKITEDFNYLIKYLCNRINSVEWSGILFYETEGDVNSAEGVTITPVDIYPMHKGSSGYTEYDFSEEVFDYYDQHPDRFGMKYGHIHSHNNMKSFFSGTDNQELVDNCVNHAYYVSLVVNNANEMVARIAIPGKREVEGTVKYLFSGVLGNLISIPTNTKQDENVMYYIDMEIEKETVAIDELFVKRVDVLMTRNTSFVGTRFGMGSNGHGQAVQKTIPLPEVESSKDKFEVLEILKLCLGENFGDNRTLGEVFSTILSDDPSDEDVMFFLSQSLDLETVVDQMTLLQRDFYLQPTTVEILNVYRSMKNIISGYKSGRFKSLVEMMDKVIDAELRGIKQLTNEG